MRQEIQRILEQIPRGKTFDSHFVISRLIKEFSDSYLDFAASISTDSNRTLIVHGKIGLEISTFEGNLITKNPSGSWSENIHGTPSECASWHKQ